MAKTSGELEQEFITNARELTGKSLEEWLKIVGASGIDKRNDILEWLKKEQGLNHMQAQFVAGIFMNNGQPVYINENALLDQQFVKCKEIRPLFESISARIMSSFEGIQLIPKKTYVSFTAKREFVAINVKPGEIRLGLDLGEEPYTDRLQKSRLTGPMPRISHMVVLKDMEAFDAQLTQWITDSYHRTHKK
ncbi:MAG TPA: DUF5655 domain-containing protein [Saprospiraceae bacterium]|nr:DUF5655 domain-containing protein [Saprospiraceae bacterium]